MYAVLTYIYSETFPCDIKYTKLTRVVDFTELGTFFAVTRPEDDIIIATGKLNCCTLLGTKYHAVASFK